MDRTKPWSIALTLSLLLPALTLGLMVLPTPLSPVVNATAETYVGPCTAEAAEITGQSKEMEMRLFRETEDKLTTDLDYGSGGNNQVQLAPGQSVDFRLETDVLEDLILESVNVGGDRVASLTFWGSLDSLSGAADLRATIFDGGTEIGQGETDNPMDNTFLTSERYDIDVTWTANKPYTLQQGHRIVLELENIDGEEGINIDYDVDTDAETHLTMRFQSLTCLEVSTEMYDLVTEVANDRKDTDHFEPNLPAEYSRVFVWGSDEDVTDGDILYDGGMLDALGRDNLDEVQVLIYRDGERDDPYFDETAIRTNSTDEDWLNYRAPAWDYSEEPGLDWGSHYNAEVQVTDLQGHIFNRSIPLTMDHWGSFMYLFDDDPDGELAIGGSREMNFKVRNSGGDPDTFMVTPSAVPSNWTIVPDEQELDINPGQEKEAQFIIYAPTDDEFVGDRAVIIFTAESQQAPSVQPKEFKITSTTQIGAQYEVELYFLAGDTVTYERSVSAQMNKPNEFNFTLANLGQDTDSFEIEGLWPSDVFDWDVDFVFEPQGSQDNPYLVNDIPRKDSDDKDQNKVELIAIVEPGTGGDKEEAELTIRATSQGNTSSTHEIYLTVTRSKGVTLTTSKPYIANGIPGNPVTFDLTIESSQDGDHTYKLSSNTPSELSGKFTDGSGTTLVDVTLEKDERKSIKYQVDDLPDDITYLDGGYVISLLVEDVADSDVRFPLSVSFNIAQNVKFSLDPGKTRVEGKPGDEIYLKLEINNDGNTADSFTISWNSGPSGWKFSINPNPVSIGAEQSQMVTIRVTIPDDALNGEKEIIELAIKAANADQTQSQKFTVEIKADFGERMKQVIEDNWYLLMLAPLMIIGYIVWSRSVAYEDDEEEEDQDYDEPDTSSSDDDFDDWD